MIIKIIEYIIFSLIFVFIIIPFIVLMGMEVKLTRENIKKIYSILFR
jgi:hypothetical protein